jgi:hypothetical protein
MLENYTNLSPHFLAASLIASSAALGVGLVAAFRLLPAYRRNAAMKSNGQSAPAINALAASDEKKLSHGQGRLRKSEIMGFDGDLLRFRDGSYGRAYRITLANTIYQSEEFTENRIDEIASLLNFDKPAGSVIQIRFESLPDGGTILRNHLGSRNAEREPSARRAAARDESENLRRLNHGRAD